MLKQVSLPKISSIHKKWKSAQKGDIRPFCTKSFNCFIVDNASVIFFLATALRRVQGVEPRDFSPSQETLNTMSHSEGYQQGDLLKQISHLQFKNVPAGGNMIIRENI